MIKKKACKLLLKNVHLNLKEINMVLVFLFLSLSAFADEGNPFNYNFLLEPHQQMVSGEYLSSMNDFDNSVYNADFKTTEKQFGVQYTKGFKNSWQASLRMNYASLKYEKEKHRSESGIADFEFGGKWLAKQFETAMLFIRPYLHLPSEKRDVSGSVPGEAVGNGVRGTTILGAKSEFVFPFDRVQFIASVGLEWSQAQKIKADNETWDLPSRLGPQWAVKAQFHPYEGLTLGIAKTFSRYQRTLVHRSQPFEGKQQDQWELMVGFHVKERHNIELGYRKTQNTIRVPGNSSEVVGTTDQNWLGYTYQF
jgi:hypothetical protein